MFVEYEPNPIEDPNAVRPESMDKIPGVLAAHEEFPESTSWF